MKNKHMILSDRIDIEKGLNNGNSIRKIGRDIDKPHTTILYEIAMRKHLVKGNPFNLIPGSSNNCIKLEKSPHVCNNCDEKRKRRKNKYFYYAKEAQHNYNSILVESRSGIDMDCDEYQYLCSVLEKEVVEQSHSFYMVKVSNEEIERSVRSLYRDQENGILPTKNIDLPRKVRYKKREKKIKLKMNLNRYQIIELVELIVTGKFFEKKTISFIIFKWILLKGLKVKQYFLLLFFYLTNSF